MIKKTITYTDYDGNERTEDFYFNLSKAEVTEWQLSKQGGMEKLLEKIIAEQDQPKMMEYFKEIIKKSYGQKSLDGKRFVKSEELWEEFSQTEAYSDLYMELVLDDQKAWDFIQGVMPSDIGSTLDKVAGEPPKTIEEAKEVINKVEAINNNENA